jgi:HPt (histidine-containing phosphotransfer) domain-containing protein
MVDLSFLEKFTKGDSKKMKRYISLYLDVTPKTFEEMRRNLEDSNWEQLRINAHSLKPQADFMGITTLKHALIEIEESIKSNNLEAVNNNFNSARNICIESNSILKSILKK